MIRLYLVKQFFTQHNTNRSSQVSFPSNSNSCWQIKTNMLRKMLLWSFVNFLIPGGAQLNIHIFCYKSLVLVSREQQQHTFFFFKVDSNMLFLCKLQRLCSETGKSSCNSPGTATTVHIEPRQKLFAHEVKHHDKVRTSNNSDLGWVWTIGIGIKTLTEGHQKPDCFPTSKAKMKGHSEKHIRCRSITWKPSPKGLHIRKGSSDNYL